MLSLEVEGNELEDVTLSDPELWATPEMPTSRTLGKILIGLLVIPLVAVTIWVLIQEHGVHLWPF